MEFSVMHSSSVGHHAICLVIEKYRNATELVSLKSEHQFKKKRYT